jgi:hypothetical protein
MNNLFSTRFVRNQHNMDSLSPFLIATDSDGKIAFAQPVKTSKLDKITEYFDNIKANKTVKAESKPYVVSTEEEFD